MYLLLLEATFFIEQKTFKAKNSLQFEIV